MAAPPSTDDVLIAMVELVREHGSINGAAKATGIARSTIQSRLTQAARRGLDGSVPPGSVPPGFHVSRRSARYDASGRLHSQSVTTKPEPGDPFIPRSGHVIKGESALVDADGNTLARWIKTREGAASSLADALREHFAAYAGAAPVIPPPATVIDDLLTVYILPDLHIGAMAWGRETGDSYDLKIAAERAVETVGTLVAQSQPSRRAVVLGLGDFFHLNDRTNMTPRSGHVLDVDQRWPKVFATGAKVATTIVDMAAQRHEQVLVRFLPGNHDPDAAICLTVALSLFYSANERIKVDDDPGIHWYTRFGRVLLGASHGHTMKPDRMAMMLAADRPKDWGETVFRHFFFGHVHHESAREVGPVRVESFNTPASRDAYAHAGGYRAGQSMNAITFHAERGEIGRHRVNIVVRTP